MQHGGRLPQAELLQLKGVKASQGSKENFRQMECKLTR